MSNRHEANDRAFRSAEAAYLREPAWRSGEDDACPCGAPALDGEAYCAECIGHPPTDNTSTEEDTDR